MGKKKNSKGQNGHGATPATVALDRAGVPFTVRTFEHTAGVTDFGAEAAAALSTEHGEDNVAPERICKTLLVSLEGGGGKVRDGSLAVAVLPVTTHLDLKAAAAVFGAKKASMADPAAAERSTGYVVGGISPLGQKKQLPTVLDASADGHDTVLVSGGRRGLDIEIAPADLVSVLDATVAPVAVPD